MNVDKARRLFATAEHAHLASVNPDGSPHIVPFTFVVATDVIYWAVDNKPKSSRRLQRLINIEAEPRVSALADGYSSDWSSLWWVRADGTSTPTDGAASEEALELLSSKYPQYRDDPPKGPVMAISVRKWSGWSTS